jgi:hypothetical protein
MNEDLDNAAIEAARGYRRADIVPRDAIWRQIETRRGDTSRRHAWRPGASAAAAVALFAVGIGTGWMAHQHTGGTAPATPTAVVSEDIRGILNSSDSLIAVFQIAGQTGRVRAELGPWARELLDRASTMNRASADTTLTRLLADLDLVLVAISQYAADPRPATGEAALIDDAIRTRKLARQLSTVLGGHVVAEPGS